jgi:hypothetical protein
MATQDSKTRVRVASGIINDAVKFCDTYTEADDKYKLKWAKKRDDIIESLGQLQADEFTDGELNTPCKGYTLREYSRRVEPVRRQLIGFQEAYVDECRNASPKPFTNVFNASTISCVEVGTCLLEAWVGKTVFASLDKSNNIMYKVNNGKFISREEVLITLGMTEDRLREECSKKRDEMMVCFILVQIFDCVF